MFYVCCLLFVLLLVELLHTEDRKNGSDSENQNGNEKNKETISTDNGQLLPTSDGDGSSKPSENLFVYVSEYDFEENDSIVLFKIEGESSDNKNFIFKIKRNNKLVDVLLRVGLKKGPNLFGTSDEATKIGSISGHEVSIGWNNDNLNFYVEDKDATAGGSFSSTTTMKSWQFKKNNKYIPITSKYVLEPNHSRSS
jgi:hypothetical protein